MDERFSSENTLSPHSLMRTLVFSLNSIQQSELIELIRLIRPVAFETTPYGHTIMRSIIFNTSL